MLKIKKASFFAALLVLTMPAQSKAAGCIVTFFGCYCFDMSLYTSSPEQSLRQYMDKVLSQSDEALAETVKETFSDIYKEQSKSLNNILNHYSNNSWEASSDIPFASANEKPPVKSPMREEISTLHDQRRAALESAVGNERGGDVSLKGSYVISRSLSDLSDDLRAAAPYHRAIDAPSWIALHEPYFYTHSTAEAQIKDWYGADGFGEAPDGKLGLSDWLLLKPEDLPQDSGLDQLTADDLELLLAYYRAYLSRKVALHGMSGLAQAEPLILTAETFTDQTNKAAKSMSGGGAAQMRAQALTMRLKLTLMLEALDSSYRKEQLYGLLLSQKEASQ